MCAHMWGKGRLCLSPLPHCCAPPAATLSMLRQFFSHQNQELYRSASRVGTFLYLARTFYLYQPYLIGNYG
jgi:hypothetical protein